MILCSLNNLTLSFGQRLIFDQTSLTIHQGDRIGLIGLNGQGKSTLFNILTEKITPDHSSPPFKFDKNREHFSILLIPQELDITSFPTLSISNYFLAFYPELYQIHLQLEKLQEEINQGEEKALEQQQQLLERFEFLNGWKIQNSYESYLKYFNIQHKTKSLHQLSGGEQRKLALSVGLSATENIILWDEPTNHLDIETIEKFEIELENSDKTFMIISHDRYLLNNITNKIVHISNGKINSFQGNYLTYLEHLELKEQERLKNLETLKNRHRRELAWMRQGIKARGTRSKKRVEGFHNIEQQIQELKAQSHKTTSLSLQHTGRKSKQLLQIINGAFSYNDKPLLKNLNLTITREDKIALIGPNGAGKSTLINLLQGKLSLQSGSLKSLDQLKILCFDQKRDSLNLDLTPAQLIGDGMDMIEGPHGQIHIKSYLKKFLFTSEQIDRPIRGLSGGEKNRLQLALFMKERADLWIFDEPTNDLDIETINILEEELINYPSAVIIIGHDRAFLDNVCKKTWLIYQQQIEEFIGGFSQVAPFLEAIQLEEEENATRTTPKNKKERPKKLTYQEQKRLEQMEELILTAESEVTKLDQSLADFDFSTMDQDKQNSYQQLTQKKDCAEAKLQSLYEEWEELMAKQEAYEKSTT